MRNARHALTEGLTRLGLAVNDMLSLAVRGDGGSKRTRSRPHHPNETPARQGGPGGNSRQVGGRVASPARPPMPAQPGAGQPPGGGVPEPDDVPPGSEGERPESINPNTETAVLPVVPAGASTSGRPGGAAPGHPDRPDPSDPAREVWALVERAQAGEPEAFGLIYDRYVDTVFRFVYFRVGNRQLAEDLTSDTFLRALKRIGSFTWQGRDLGAWLVTIARNLVADHFKSGRYRLEVTTGDVLDADREDRGPEGSPEAAVVEHITNVALLTAVKQLNPEQQECIVLRFLQGFSVAETAQAMGKNEGAIKALQYRAVRALARLLPDGFQP
ncbi:sigma-70 family RNA polymerase sigma factor [Micromonospora sp. HM5-17]|jgi:RNA polymerase sigma-70 factor (ECF subfamily)|nr:sigma-70 family RNA polymerase sigma factor [Micromonospora sp. HM5-17]